MKNEWTPAGEHRIVERLPAVLLTNLAMVYFHSVGNILLYDIAQKENKSNIFAKINSKPI